jgi:hypothetical protein
VLKGFAIWGGIQDFVDASMTYTPGVAPNMATIQIPPQDAGKIYSAGPLIWRFGDQTWTFQGCRLQSIRSRLTDKGNVWELSILDRRWVWTECGKISGYYNARAGEKLKPGTEKKPQDLARLCLEAMGEQRFDVSQLPNEARPEVDWDYILPSEALAQLCDQLGCVIILGLNNRVSIQRKYVGAQLPVPGITQGDLALRPPDPPGRIIVTGARSRFQAELPLRAVGKDTDGSVKPIEELSYRPEGGWGFSDLQDFSGMSDPTAKKLAQESVYRWFRVEAPFKLPNLRGEVDDVRRILPLETVQVEKWERDNRQVPRPAWVYGEFWAGDDTGRKSINISDTEANLREKSQAIWQNGFSIDATHGIVKLSEPCYLLELSTLTTESNNVPKRVNPQNIPPKLWLRTAVSLRDAKTWGWLRSEFERRFSGRSAAPAHARYFRHDDIIHEQYFDFERGTGRLIENYREINKAGQYYLDRHAIEYNPEQSAAISYVGLKPIQVDGAIWQVAWSISGGMATTQATRNREEMTLSVSYQEKRFLAKLAQDQIERNKPQRQRDDDDLKRKAPS